MGQAAMEQEVAEQAGMEQEVPQLAGKGPLGILPPVTVNGAVISAERIADEMQNHPAPKGRLGLARKAAARALALREMLLQEARARGIGPAPQQLGEGLWESDDDSIIRLLLEEAVTPDPIDDAALRALYDAEPGRFRSPALYEAAHILIPADPRDDAARTAARAQAQALCDRLRCEPGAFSRLAAEFSACASRENGGMMGQLASGDTVPEFEAALAGLEEGTISETPAETRYGFHVIRLDARASGNVLDFDAVLPRLREAQEKAAWVRASRAFMAALVARAEVTGIVMTDPAPQAAGAG